MLLTRAVAAAAQLLVGEVRGSVARPHAYQGCNMKCVDAAWSPDPAPGSPRLPQHSV